MGRIRRGGYIFISWVGDHPPRHVHIYDDNANFITRMNLETMQPMDVVKVDKGIVDIIRDLQTEGRLWRQQRARKCVLEQPNFRE